MCVPSGDHEGQSSCTALRVTRRHPEPSARITQISVSRASSAVGSGLRRKTIRRPSGDHAAANSAAGEPAVRFRGRLPTDVKENQVEWPQPADYDERRYELLLRNFEAGDRRVPWAPTLMPNR